jgi:hypothetical protein
MVTTSPVLSVTDGFHVDETVQFRRALNVHSSE